MSQHHDPVHPDSGHLTPELLADLAEGLLDPTSAQHAKAHLDQCSLCQGVQASLRDVSATLAALPTPSMPDDVEAQLLAALPAAAGDHPVGAPTVVPLAAERTRRRGWAGPSLGIAASVALVLFVGGLLYPALTSNDGDGPTAATSDFESSRSAAAEDALTSLFDASNSGTKYEADRLSAQVEALVQERERELSGAAPSGSLAESADPTNPTSSPYGTATGDAIDAAKLAARAPMANDPAAAQACLEQYLGAPDVVPLAIDIGWFQGKLAAIIVLPSSTNPDEAEVWIVDPGCAGPDSVVLHWASVPLP